MTTQRLPATGKGILVAGTDTGVGKTLVACALLHAFANRGSRVIGMKPVAAGACPGTAGLVNEDVERILAAGNVTAPRAFVNPYCFALPVAPHIAAQETGTEIDPRRIEAAYAALAQCADVVIVEGTGGFRVPLNAREDTAGLAVRLGLPVLLVVGVRLGCLNHALLTAEAVRARGLKIAGWVANRIDPEMAHAEENVLALTDRLAAPLIADIGFSADPDARRVAAAIKIDLLGG